MKKRLHPLGLPAAPRSHSTSVGRRYGWPVFRDSHPRTPARRSSSRTPRDAARSAGYPAARQERRRRSSVEPQGGSGAASGTASTKARNSSRITSNRPRATSAPNKTTISGQTSQSRNTSPGVCAPAGAATVKTAHATSHLLMLHRSIMRHFHGSPGPPNGGAGIGRRFPKSSILCLRPQSLRRACRAGPSGAQGHDQVAQVAVSRGPAGSVPPPTSACAAAPLESCAWTTSCSPAFVPPEKQEGLTAGGSSAPLQLRRG